MVLTAGMGAKRWSECHYFLLWNKMKLIVDYRGRSYFDSISCFRGIA
jgi:hypothetical protein